MSAPELKNCPFCGSPPEYEPWHGGLPTKMMIMCGNRPDGSGGDCMVSPMVTGETMDEAAENWNRRTDLSQASVAAALEAAAAHIEEEFGTVLSANAIRALITPDQHDALAAHVAAAVAEARAEDAAVLSKLIEATETARDYVSDASMGYVWHQDQSGSPLVKLDTKMPKDDIKAIDAALAAARDVEASLTQIGAKP